jgi:hypothetical protein
METRGLNRQIQLKGKILVRDVLRLEDRFTHIEYLTLEMSIEDVFETVWRTL